MKRAVLTLIGLILIKASVTVASPTETRVWIGASTVWSPSVVFTDKDCNVQSVALYFGCGTGSDDRQLGAYGKINSGYKLSVGIERSLTSWLTTGLDISRRNGAFYSGSSNFLTDDRDEFVSTAFQSTSVLLNLKARPSWAEFTLANKAVRPVLLGGVGRVRYSLGESIYRFPTLGVGAETRVPARAGYSTASHLGVGFEITLNPQLSLELLLKRGFIDAVDAGNDQITVVRPGRPDRYIDVASIRTHLRSDEIGLRLLYAL